MNLQENTVYDLTKLTLNQRILLFTNLYYKRSKEVISNIENYICTAEDYTFKTLVIGPNYSCSILTQTREDAICATTLFLTFPRLIEVRDREQYEWQERVAVFIDHKNRPYTYGEIEDVSKIPEADSNLLQWGYYREIPQKITLTKQEIADKFKLNVNEIEIV